MHKKTSEQYANITKKNINTCLHLCEICQLKKSKFRKSIVVKPIISDNWNSRCQVDLIDMQNQKDGGSRFILNYQDHLVAGRASGCKMLPNLWMMRTSKSNTHTRASSTDDVQSDCRETVRSGLRLSYQERDMMERRGINILCVQETRRKEEKAREIGNGYKLFYYGVDGKKNGVGIVLDGELKKSVLTVNRESDRIMWMKIEICEVVMNLISVYAPQAGCDEEEKDRFWEQIEDMMVKIP